MQKTIAVCIYSFDLGGAEKVAVTLINTWHSLGYTIYVYCFKKRGILLNELSIPISNIFEIGGGISLIQILKATNILNKELRKNEKIPLLCIGELPNIIGGLLSKYFNVTLSEHSTNTFINTKKLYGCSYAFNLLAIFAYKNSNKIIAVSDSVSNLLANISKCLEIKTIYNPIDFTLIKEKSKIDINSNEKYLFNKYVIIMIGRLHKSKDYILAINTFIRIKNKHNFNMIIIGEGQEKNKITDYIKKCNLENNIFLFGEKTNPYPYLANASIFLSTSLYEGFSINIFEAIILNKYIVTTRSYSTIDNFVTKDLGTIIDERNPELLAKAIEQHVGKKTITPEYIKDLDPAVISQKYIDFIFKQ